MAAMSVCPIWELGLGLGLGVLSCNQGLLCMGDMGDMEGCCVYGSVAEGDRGAASRGVRVTVRKL